MRKGEYYYKKKKYFEAIEEFKASYEFFNKRKWVDKYRCVTMLSPTNISFAERSLLSIAACYQQIGDIKKTKEYTEFVLKEFPDNEQAKSFLKFYEMIKQNVLEEQKLLKEQASTDTI